MATAISALYLSILYPNVFIFIIMLFKGVKFILSHHLNLIKDWRAN